MLNKIFILIAAKLRSIPVTYKLSETIKGSVITASSNHLHVNCDSKNVNTSLNDCTTQKGLQ